MRSDAGRGVLLLLFTVLVFSISDAVGKIIAESYGGMMVSWARFVFATITLPLILPHRLREMVVTRQPGLQAIRSMVVIGANTLFFVSLRYIPLADAVAIGFFSPFITTALSIPILKEKVGIRRWAAIGVGFVGILVIVRPGFEARHWAYVLPMISSTFWAFYVVLTRKLGPSESPLATLFFTPIAGAIALTVSAPLYWEWPRGGDWWLLVLIGVLATAGHLTLIRAYRLASASMLAPFNYASIVFATAFGYALFGTFPDAWTFAGVAIIVASGVYMFQREALRKRDANSG